MRKCSGMWLSWGLSSLAVAGSLIATVSVTKAVTWNQTIAPKTLHIAQGGSVGGPLAKQLQGKPVVVDIYASWCPACTNIAPTLAQLKREYAGKAHFVVLDVSDPSKVNQSKTKAKQLGLSSFFEKNKAQTGFIAIIDPATGKILAQHRNNANKSAYTTVLNAAIAKK
jgi:thiol-disulfide isomerase/thioredoxin